MVTQKIKSRVIYVYPALKQSERWRDLAQKQGLTLSKFVMEHVENSLRQEEDPAFESRAAMAAHLHDYEDKFSECIKEIRMLRIVVDKLEKENQRFRAEQFAEEGFQGIRRYEEALIDLLRKGQSVDEKQIFRELAITPNETDLVKAISNQLVSLESYGLVKRTSNGWRWGK